ncbi:MAG TPA: YncE family protein [Gaiellaceae bacterium]
MLSTVVLAAAVAGVQGPSARVAACNPDNGIGPDGGLAALPPPTQAGARYLDLDQSAAPVDVELDPASGRLFVVQRGLNSVAVVDGRSAKPRVLATVTVGKRPEQAVLDTKSKRLFVANGASCSVSIFDVRTSTPRLLATLPAAAGPRGLSLDPKTGRVYTANYTGNTIRVIDGRAARPRLLPKPLNIGSGHVAAAVDAKTRRLVLVSSSGQVQTLDLNGGKAPVTGVVSVGGAIGLAGDGSGYVYSSGSGGQVTKIDVRKAPATQASLSGPLAGGGYSQIRYEQRLKGLLLTSRSPAAVLVVSPATLKAQTTVPSTSALAAARLDPAGCRLWMLDYSYHRIWSVPLPGC